MNEYYPGGSNGTVCNTVSTQMVVYVVVLPDLGGTAAGRLAEHFS